MGLSDAVSSALGLSEPTARFLLALFAAYPFSFLYRLIVTQQPRVKNIYLTLSGVAIVYYVYGVHLWHSAVDVISVYAVLTIFGGTLLSVVLTWTITMGHIMYGYVSVALSGEVHPISWTIPQCVLVLKLIGLSFNLYDANKKQAELTADQRQTVITAPPSFLEMAGFSYFHGSVLAGPQLSFRRYREFVNGTLFDWNGTPSSLLPGLLRLLQGVAMSIVFSLLNQHFSLSTLTSDEYIDYSFPMRVLLVVVCGKVALWRYISVWLIAEGSCMVTGVSYNGRDPGGNVDWYGLANIHVWKSETSITLQGIVDSFNINTNKWVSMYVFKRLRWLGNKSLSFILTMVFVSLWHGIWPGYALCFSMEFLGIFAERSFVATTKKLLGCSLSDFGLPLRILLTLLIFALRNILLMYPLAMFMLLSWQHCYKLMSAVYFYAHVLLLGWMILYHLIISPLSPRRPKTE